MIYRWKEGHPLKSWRIGIQWKRGPFVWFGKILGIGFYLHHTRYASSVWNHEHMGPYVRREP